MDFGTLLRYQRQFFSSQKPMKIGYRLNALVQLKNNIVRYEKQIAIALHDDLGKSEFESYATEIGLVKKELDYIIKHLYQWAKPKKYPIIPFLLPSRSLTLNEPYGVALIIAPWNYPFLLIMSPLLGALAAGNCVILKPSTQAPNTLVVVKKIIKETFDPNYVSLVDGTYDDISKMLEYKYDYIFYTGGVNYGKEVLKSAARHITPTTLELGGKNPCIVAHDARLALAAKRIVWGKFLNCGQTCVAPDYLLVHVSVKEQLIREMIAQIEEQFTTDPATCPDYPRIINEKQLDRLIALLPDGHILCGGTYDKENRYMAPTIMDDVKPTSPVMQQEIFGPILPIITYEKLTEAVDFINKREKPLALYMFSQTQPDAFYVTKNTSSGAIGINEVVTHVANYRLPFGGVGNSGMGAYHGKFSYETFSHTRSITYDATRFDLPIRYAPHTLKRMKWLKRFL